MVALDEKTLKALNQHVVAELTASHEYLAASSYMADVGLEGMASWMRSQSDEERSHAMKFYGHIHDRGGRVHLGAIPSPPEDYDGPLDVFEQALRREQETTEHINQLYGESMERHDYALQIFLQWFIQEQVREEDGIQRIVDRLNLIGDDKAALVILDDDLGSRNPPDAP